VNTFEKIWPWIFSSIVEYDNQLEKPDKYIQTREETWEKEMDILHYRFWKKLPAELVAVDDRNAAIHAVIHDNNMYQNGNRLFIYKQYTDQILNVDDQLDIEEGSIKDFDKQIKALEKAKSYIVVRAKDHKLKR
jgi:hypothetical protein